MAKFPRELDSARKQDTDAIRPRELVKRAIYRAVDSDMLSAQNRLTAPLDILRPSKRCWTNRQPWTPSDVSQRKWTRRPAINRGWPPLQWCVTRAFRGQIDRKWKSPAREPGFPSL